MPTLTVFWESKSRAGIVFLLSNNYAVRSYYYSEICEHSIAKAACGLTAVTTFILCVYVLGKQGELRSFFSEVVVRVKGLFVEPFESRVAKMTELGFGLGSLYVTRLRVIGLFSQ